MASAAEGKADEVLEDADLIPEDELLNLPTIDSDKCIMTNHNGEDVVLQVCSSMTCEDIHNMDGENDNRVKKFICKLVMRYAMTDSRSFFMLAADANTSRKLMLRITYPGVNNKKKASVWRTAFLVGNVIEILDARRGVSTSPSQKERCFLEVDERATVVMASDHVAQRFSSVEPCMAPVLARRVANSVANNQLTDSLLHVKVMKKQPPKKSTGGKTFCSISIADREGVVWLKAWGKEDVEWLGGCLEEEKWYAIQNLIFSSSIDEYGQKWEQFTARKKYTKIRPLTEEEIAKQEPVPEDCANDGEVHKIEGRFHAVWNEWQHYVCAECGWKRNGQECDNCKPETKGGGRSNASWRWFWGGYCSVKPTKGGTIMDFTFTSKHVGRLLPPQVVEDTAKSVKDKMDFLTQQLVCIEYWQGNRKRNRDGDGVEKIIKSITLTPDDPVPV